MKRLVENKKLVYGIILFLLILSAFIWNKYYIEIHERPVKPIKLPKIISKECGIENCHGLDITCGPNVPERCTMEYALGDRCRQYASCKVIDGKCQLVKSEKFEKCKSCVEKCLRDFKDDSVRLFECESKCEEATTSKVGVACGGWDTFGEVVCECSGHLEKFVCPPNSVCDSGTDVCYGSCGECKCYQGPAKNGFEIPCDGRDKYFK